MSPIQLSQPIQLVPRLQSSFKWIDTGTHFNKLNSIESQTIQSQCECVNLYLLDVIRSFLLFYVLIVSVWWIHFSGLYIYTNTFAGVLHYIFYPHIQKDDSLCLLATNPSKSLHRNDAQNKKEKRQLIIATTLCFFFMVSDQQVFNFYFGFILFSFFFFFRTFVNYTIYFVNSPGKDFNANS